MELNIDSVIFDSESVDALTVTSKSVEGRAMVAGLYRCFAEESGELGFQKVFKSLGYSGFQCRSVRYGKRLDGSVLFSSGQDAMNITHMLVNDYDYLELKTTRVDLCVDVALELPKRGWLRGLRESEAFSENQSRANRSTTLIESTTGDTLYIGSRKSGRFGRIYDKSAAYGVVLGSVYRFELETKKQVAPAVFKKLFPEKEDSTYSFDLFASRCRSLIQTQFRQWGVDIDLGAKDKEQVRAEVRVSTLESQLEWLSRSVKPVVVKLIKTGHQSQMFEALGLEYEQL